MVNSSTQERTKKSGKREGDEKSTTPPRNWNSVLGEKKKETSPLRFSSSEKKQPGEGRGG